MAIPTEPVGSLPRPQYLQAMFAEYDAERASLEELQAAQERAAVDSVRRMEETGQEIVTDGEQRVCSFPHSTSEG
jgi:methionine synthase II (cobalamin-independent)